MIRPLRRLLAGAVLATVAATTAGIVAAAPAQAYIGPPAWGHVYNGASPRCLDSGVPQNTQLWSCSTAIYQQWRLTQAATIVGNSPTGCLDDGAGLNGSGAYLAPCSGSPHQRWYGNPGGGSFVNAASGRCLDADLGTIGQQGTRVQVWDCNGWANQYWAFEFTQ